MEKGRTIHNQASPGQIAPKVIMPGDPLRARYIAEKYLEDSFCFNTERGMLGYTGKYKGSPVSVMGSGMGIPSIGIYSRELYEFYGVELIIRAGTCGILMDKPDLGDIVLAQGASTDSNYQNQFDLKGTLAPLADFDTLLCAYKTAEELGIPVKVGNVLSSDCFYCDDPESQLKFGRMNVLCVEMEAAGLYMNAARFGKKALAVLTCTDDLVNHISLDSDARLKDTDKMIEICLETCLKV